MKHSSLPALARILIALIPLTAAIGTYLLPVRIGAFEIFGFRILVLCCFAGLLLSKGFGWPRLARQARSFFWLAGFWMIWGCFALIWAPTMWDLRVENALVEILALLFGFAVCAVMLGLSRGQDDSLSALRVGWLLAFIATSCVAIWEITTRNHLPGYQVDNADFYALDSIVFSTFGNPNNYAAFLVLCFPFLLWSQASAKGFAKVIYFSLLLIVPVLVFVAQGRLSIFALFLQFLLLLLFYRKEPRRLLATSLPLFLFAGVVGFSVVMSPETSKLLNLMYEFQGGSAELRLNLVRNGLGFIAQSVGTGIGPGNYRPMMERGQGHYYTEGLVDPHNFWIEVGAQYGFLVLVLLIAWLAGVARALLRARKAALERRAPQARMAAEAALLGLLAYPLLAAENSAYIAQQINWVFLGSVLVVANCLSHAPSMDHRRNARQMAGAPLRQRTDYV